MEEDAALTKTQRRNQKKRERKLKSAFHLGPPQLAEWEEDTVEREDARYAEADAEARRTEIAAAAAILVGREIGKEGGNAELDEQDMMNVVNMTDAVVQMIKGVVEHARNDPGKRIQVSWNYFELPPEPPQSEKWKKVMPQAEAGTQTDDVGQLTTKGHIAMGVEAEVPRDSLAAPAATASQQPNEPTRLQSDEELWLAALSEAERRLRSELQLDSGAQLDEKKLHEKATALLKAKKKKLKAKEKKQQKALDP